MHYRLVKLVLEVVVPARAELLHVILLQFLLSRSHLDTSLNAISSQRASAISVPLAEHPLLSLRIAPDEIVKALRLRLGSIGGEREIVVLEIEADAWEFNLAFHAGFLELLGISDAGALQDEWGAERAAGDDDLLARADDGFLLLARVEGLHGDCANGGCAAVFEDDFVDFGVAHQVEVTVVSVFSR